MTRSGLSQTSARMSAFGGKADIFEAHGGADMFTCTPLNPHPVFARCRVTVDRETLSSSAICLCVGIVPFSSNSLWAAALTWCGSTFFMITTFEGCSRAGFGFSGNKIRQDFCQASISCLIRLAQRTCQGSIKSNEDDLATPQSSFVRYLKIIIVQTALNPSCCRRHRWLVSHVHTAPLTCFYSSHGSPPLDRLSQDVPRSTSAVD
jgi:hypothetical protein